MQAMVEKWCKELRTLAEIAAPQPQAAYAVFTKGLSVKWKYHVKSMQCPPETFFPLDELIDIMLLPAFTGREFAKEQPESAS